MKYAALYGLRNDHDVVGNVEAKLIISMCVATGVV